MSMRSLVSSPLPRSWVGAAALAALTVGAATARADVVDQVDFDAPDFVVGGIDGQSGWTAVGAATVESGSAVAGGQFLQLDVDPGAGPVVARHALSFDPAAADSSVLHVRAFVRFDRVVTSGVTVLGIEGDAGVLAELVVQGGAFTVANATGTPVAIAAGEWQLVELRADLEQRTVTAEVDGVLAGIGSLGGLSTTVQSIAVIGADDATPYELDMDQLAVQSAPPSILRAGFEPGRFVAGPLPGQQDWEGRPEFGFLVQTAVTRSGSGALHRARRAEDPNGGPFYLLLVDPSSTPSPVVTIEYDYRADFTQSLVVGSHLVLRSSDAFLMQILPNADLWRLGGASSAAATGVSVDSGRWYRFRLELDFATRRADLWIDGRFEASQTVARDDLRSMSLLANGNVDYEAYWDNFRITSAPARLYQALFETPTFATSGINGQDGWTGTAGATVLAEFGRTSNGGLAIATDSRGTAQEASRAISVDRTSAASDGAVFRCSFATGFEPDVGLELLALEDAAGTPISTIVADSGSFHADFGDGPVGSRAVDAEEWHTLETRVDLASKRVATYVNGELLATGAIPASVTEIETLAFRGPVASSSYEYQIDDVTITPLDFPSAPDITTTVLPDWTAGVEYVNPGGVQFAADGVGPFTWGFEPGTLPTGIGFDAAGLLVGTPTETGTFGFTPAAVDVYGQTGRRALPFTVNPPPSITSTAIRTGAANRPFAGTVRSSGGTAPLTYRVVGAPLPSGLTLDPATGQLSGSPTESFVGPLQVEVTDAVGVSDAADVAFGVALPFELRRGKASERFSFDEGEPRSGARYLELVANSTLDIDFSGRFGDELPVVRLIGPDGELVDAGDTFTSSSSRLRFRRTPVTTTGRYFLTWTFPESVERSVRLKLRIRSPKRYSGVIQTQGGGATVEIPFTAATGSRLRGVRVKGKGVRPRIVSLLDEDETDLVPLGKLKNARTAKFKLAEPPIGNRFVLTIAGDGEEAGELVYRIDLRAPREHEFSLPDVPAGE